MVLLYSFFSCVRMIFTLEINSKQEQDTELLLFCISDYKFLILVLAEHLWEQASVKLF